MTSYFPLLPNILFDGSNKIIGSITFLNYPNNFMKRNINKIEEISIYIGIYKLSNGFWKLIKIVECQFRKFVYLNRDMLNVPDNVMVVCVLRKDNKFYDKCQNLPNPHSLRVDNSVVAERASYNFTYKDSTTSYQGEYPFIMARSEKGSFVSFDSLKSYPQLKSVENFLLFMNLNISAKLNSKKIIKIYDPTKKTYLQTINARQNQISIFNMKSLDNKYLKKTLFFSSDSAIFIPLFLSLDKYSNQLSFEHTHPPADLFVGRSKFEVVKVFKQKWNL